MVVTERNRRARALFAPLAPAYDRWARLLSFGQDPSWRRFLVSRVPAGEEDRVLDVATGTGAVAIELCRRTGCTVVGVDQSPEMLAAGRKRVAETGLAARIELVEGNAERLPFADASFDALTFTYLLRYVDAPAETLHELARVVRSGGTVASLEFAVPPAPVPRALWKLYVQAGLPLAGRAIGGGWDEVGRFLGPSIVDFCNRLPLQRLAELWCEAGIEEVRWRLLSLGGGVVMWGRRT